MGTGDALIVFDKDWYVVAAVNYGMPINVTQSDGSIKAVPTMLGADPILAAGNNELHRVIRGL